MYFIRPACICTVVTLLLFATAPCFALGEWPDGPHKEWFENLRRPDNHLHFERNVDPTSQYCCERYCAAATILSPSQSRVLERNPTLAGVPQRDDGGALLASEQVVRRLMAVLAADVVGNGRLVVSDEEAPPALWQDAVARTD